MARRPGRLSDFLVRLAPTGTLAGLGTLAALNEAYLAAGLLGLGATYAGKRVLDRSGNKRRSLRQRAQGNARELGRVAREDRVSAPQMKRLGSLQRGLLESWELLPEEYGPLIEEDVFAIVEEVERTALLARRRAALRRHLEGVDRREISRRIKGLEKDLAELEPDSDLRTPFESALAGRREELASYGDILSRISVINAQLESAESLLANLRGELLALDPDGLASGAGGVGLTQLKERISYFRHSLDEVTRSADALSNSTTEELPAR